MYSLAKGELTKTLVDWLRSRRILRLIINVPGGAICGNTHHPSSAAEAKPKKTDFYPMKPRITTKTVAPPSASSAVPLPPIVHAIGKFTMYLLLIIHNI